MDRKSLPVLCFYVSVLFSLQHSVFGNLGKSNDSLPPENESHKLSLLSDSIGRNNRKTQLQGFPETANDKQLGIFNLNQVPQNLENVEDPTQRTCPGHSNGSEEQALVERQRRRFFLKNIYRRKRVPGRIATNIMPYEAVVRVVTKSGSCSGSLIGKHFALTAAHCVHNGKTQERNVQVGLLQSNRQFTRIRVQKVFLPKQWRLRRNRVKHDYAVLQLADGAQSGPFFPFKALNIRAGTRIAFNSFSGHRVRKTMWFVSCPVLRVSSNVILHRCDTAPGSSGAGVYTKIGTEFIIVGVHSFSRGRYNVAIRLTKPKVRKICNWMKKKC